MTIRVVAFAKAAGLALVLGNALLAGCAASAPAKDASGSPGPAYEVKTVLAAENGASAVIAAEDPLAPKGPWGKTVAGQAISVAVERRGSFETKKAVFAVGEPIMLCVWLKNFGNIDVVGPYRAEGGEAALLGYSLRVALAGGEDVPFSTRGRETLAHFGHFDPAAVGGSLPQVFDRLRPGQSDKLSWELTALFDLSRPGTYLVSARKRMVKPGGKLSASAVVSEAEGISNTFEITVVDAGLEQLKERLKDMEHPRDGDANPALDLGKTWISDEGLQRIEGMTQIRQLSLAETPNVTDAGLRHLEKLTQLRRLSLAGNRNLTDAGLTRLAKSLTNLEALDLCDTNVTDAGLDSLRTLSHLRKLDLSKATVFSTQPQTAITDAGLAHLKGLTQLEDLSIVGIGITDAGLEHLKPLTKLQCLNMDGSNGLTDAGLEQLQGMTHLRRLYLGFAKVTDAGLERLTGFAELQSLQLGSGDVTDAGLRHLQKLARLEQLRLTSCPRISDAGLKHLAALQHLSWLEVYANVTAEGVNKLEQALPKCTVNAGPPWPH
jgi:hypothetical protein